MDLIYFSKSDFFVYFKVWLYLFLSFPLSVLAMECKKMTTVRGFFINFSFWQDNSENKLIFKKYYLMLWVPEQKIK